MNQVIIESPFAGKSAWEENRNKKYLEACIFDSLGRGEAPFASHGFYTHFLKDTEPAEREKGMECGRAWAESADIVAFYVDYDMSPGMLEMLEWVFERIKDRMILRPHPEIRRLPTWLDEEGHLA